MQKRYTHEEHDFITKIVQEYMNEGKSILTAFDYLSKQLNRESASISRYYYRSIRPLDKEVSTKRKPKKAHSDKTVQPSSDDSIMIDYFVNSILINRYVSRTDFNELSKKLNIPLKEVMNKYRNDLKVTVRNQVKLKIKERKELIKTQRKNDVEKIKKSSSYSSTLEKSLSNARKVKNSMIDIIYLIDKLEKENKMLKLEIEKLKLDK